MNIPDYCTDEKHKDISIRFIINASVQHMEIDFSVGWLSIKSLWNGNMTIVLGPIGAV